MCSNVQDGKTLPTKRIPNLEGQPCVKCGEPGVLIIRIHDSFCKACFQVYVVHKFRAAIGKSKLIRDGEHVMVAFSGGANSAALLHLIQEGLSERAHKKLRFVPTLLHVNECELLSMPTEEQDAVQQKVTRLMLDSGFPSYATTLSLGLNMTRQDRSCTRSNPECEDGSNLYWSVTENLIDHHPRQTTRPCENLRYVLENLSSLSSHEDFVRNLRNQLIVHIAQEMGFSKVLMADCSTRLSIRTLTDVAQGRGGQVSLDTGFSDVRNNDVMLIRPVRDLNAKELVMYNNLHGVDRVFIPSVTTKGSLSASIERLTQTFVTGLQADFPSTVSNIVRTSEKLGLPDVENAAKCKFCQSPIDSDTRAASAVKSIKFSQKLSRSGRERMNAENELDQVKESCDASPASGCCGEGDGSCQSAVQPRLELEGLSSHLCYGCSLSLQGFKGDVMSLPMFITKEVERAERRDKLREEIADFLIADDDVDS